ncbi:MAG: hypothetical protein H0Z39_03400 [Peptococcaceae bacterium]|nr:hypothetical protein [Peptococcaceae bacterium]
MADWINGPCFYVSCVDGDKFVLLAGPFRTHQEALDLVDKAAKLACKLDRKAAFYSFGTVKMADGHKQGILNKYLGV